MIKLCLAFQVCNLNNLFFEQQRRKIKILFKNIQGMKRKREMHRYFIHQEKNCSPFKAYENDNLILDHNTNCAESQLRSTAQTS